MSSPASTAAPPWVFTHLPHTLGLSISTQMLCQQGLDFPLECKPRALAALESQSPSLLGWARFVIHCRSIQSLRMTSVIHNTAVQQECNVCLKYVMSW